MADRNQNTQSEHWHLDKRVPIALILAIFMQTAAGIWWAASVSARVENLERANAQSFDQPTRIVRLETKMDSIFVALEEIKQILRNQNSAAK